MQPVYEPEYEPEMVRLFPLSQITSPSDFAASKGKFKNVLGARS